MENYIGEMIIGAVLAVFGWSFRNWASTIKASTTEVLTELKALYKEFHTFHVQTENRVTRVETDMKHCNSRVERRIQDDDSAS